MQASLRIWNLGDSGLAGHRRGVGVVADVSLRGGIGRTWLVAIGAGFLLLLTNAMDLLHMDSRTQTILIGIIVVLAVAFGGLNTRVVARV